MSGKIQKVGFIGAGNMAEAIIGAIISAELYPAEAIWVSDIEPSQVKRLQKTYRLTDAGDNTTVIRECDLIFFSVKPQTLPSVLEALVRANGFSTPAEKKLLVSIAAGVQMAAIEAYVYKGLTEAQKPMRPIIRVMPNTPALVRSGTSAVCANPYAAAEDMEAVKSILSAMGRVFECRESDMNAFTAVAGSGPAYGFYLIEAMAEAGARLGLDPEDALNMTLSTLEGALKLLESQQAAPRELREKVTSPGGTTEAALRLLEDKQVKSCIIDAVCAAARRADELSG